MTDSRRRFRPSLHRSVMDALVRFSDGQEVCDPSLFELSEASGYCRRSVCRAIKDLIARQAVVADHRYAEDGRQLSNQYRLILTHAGNVT